MLGLRSLVVEVVSRTVLTSNELLSLFAQNYGLPDPTRPGGHEEWLKQLQSSQGNGSGGYSGGGYSHSGLVQQRANLPPLKGPASGGAPLATTFVDAFDNSINLPGISNEGPNSENRKLHRIVESMCGLRGLTPVPIKDRKWRTHEWINCWVGREAVQWFLNQGVVENRRQAVAVGTRMMHAALISKVSSSTIGIFHDSMLFYKFAHNEYKWPLIVLQEHSPSLADQQRALWLLLCQEMQRLRLHKLDMPRLLHEMIAVNLDKAQAKVSLTPAAKSTGADIATTINASAGSSSSATSNLPSASLPLQSTSSASASASASASTSAAASALVSLSSLPSSSSASSAAASASVAASSASAIVAPVSAAPSSPQQQPSHSPARPDSPPLDMSFALRRTCHFQGHDLIHFLKKRHVRSTRDAMILATYLLLMHTQQPELLPARTNAYFVVVGRHSQLTPEVNAKVAQLNSQYDHRLGRDMDGGGGGGGGGGGSHSKSPSLNSSSSTTAAKSVPVSLLTPTSSTQSQQPQVIVVNRAQLPEPSDPSVILPPARSKAAWSETGTTGAPQLSQIRESPSPPSTPRSATQAQQQLQKIEAQQSQSPQQQPQPAPASPRSASAIAVATPAESAESASSNMVDFLFASVYHAYLLSPAHLKSVPFAYRDSFKNADIWYKLAVPVPVSGDKAPSASSSSSSTAPPSKQSDKDKLIKPLGVKDMNKQQPSSPQATAAASVPVPSSQPHPSLPGSLSPENPGPRTLGVDRPLSPKTPSPPPAHTALPGSAGLMPTLPLSTLSTDAAFGESTMPAVLRHHSYAASKLSPAFVTAAVAAAAEPVAVASPAKPIVIAQQPAKAAVIPPPTVATAIPPPLVPAPVRRPPLASLPPATYFSMLDPHSLAYHSARSECYWEFVQSFGDDSSAAGGGGAGGAAQAELEEEFHGQEFHGYADDLVTAVEFAPSGQFLAIGDKAGRVSIVQENISALGKIEYKFYTEFQSHEPDFDCLTSLSIEPRINVIEWWKARSGCDSWATAPKLSLLTANDKTVKLWRVGPERNQVKRSWSSFIRGDNDGAAGGADAAAAAAAQPASAASASAAAAGVSARVAFAQAEPDSDEEEDEAGADEGGDSFAQGQGREDSGNGGKGLDCTPSCAAVFQNAHTHTIHSVSTCSDGETFLSADDFTANLWHTERSDECFSVVKLNSDASAVSASTVIEMMKVARFHPSDCNILMYGTSQGIIRVVDLRVAALGDRAAVTLGPNPRWLGEPLSMPGTSFHVATDAIHDARFSADGRYILVRDYLTLRLWDVTQPARPIFHSQTNPYFATQLNPLLEHAALWEEGFQCCMSSDGNHFLSGSYSNTFTLHNRITERTLTIQARGDYNEPTVINEHYTSPMHPGVTGNIPFRPDNSMWIHPTSYGGMGVRRHALANPPIPQAAAAGAGKHELPVHSPNTRMLLQQGGLDGAAYDPRVSAAAAATAAAAAAAGGSSSTSSAAVPPLSFPGLLSPPLLAADPYSAAAAVACPHPSAQFDQLQPHRPPDLHAKIMKVAWHPRHQFFAVAGLYKIFLYQAKPLRWQHTPAWATPWEDN